jgi:hypothetical protein
MSRLCPDSLRPVGWPARAVYNPLPFVDGKIDPASRICCWSRAASSLKRWNAKEFPGMRVVTFGVFAALFFAAALFANPASALTAKEADAVVSILEKMKAQGAEIAYDDDTAEDLFERDADEGKLIVKAGFNQKSWKTALDDTMKGFFATIPEAEINKIFDDLRKSMDASKMTAQQKQTVLEMWTEERKKIAALRMQGTTFATTVSPLAARLRKLTLDNLGGN